jgi:hypothetical protein
LPTSDPNLASKFPKAGAFEQLQLRSGLVLVATLCSHWRIPMRYYPATDTVKSCPIR